MDEYPDPDDEYDILHEDEMDALKDYEEDLNNLTDSNAYCATTKTRNSLQFDPPSRGSSGTNSSVQDGKRRLSLSECDNEVELLKPANKRSRINLPERLNDVDLLETSTSSKMYEVGVTSVRVPKWPFIPITTDTGERLYVRLKGDDALNKVSDMGCWQNKTLNGLLGKSFEQLKMIAEEDMLSRMESSEIRLNVVENVEDVTVRTSAELWVDKYKPTKYMDLLSDEGVNRTLLNWVKMWDKIVFNKESRKFVEETKKKDKTGAGEVQFDEDGRPHYKLALLCGPPGLGKTTLAHVIASVAGYNVVEVNASDDRSTEVFHTKLEAATQMQSVIGTTKPNCLVLDEIDGAPTASIDYLLKYVNGKGLVKSKKGKKVMDKEKSKNKLVKRPVICICNEPYLPSMRQLRQQAYVVHFPHTSSSKLAQRLLDICRKQNIRTDLSTLTLLCDKAQSDIRSCISTLHFFKAKNGQTFRAADVTKSQVGQKDIQRGLFSLWQDIFHTPVKKDFTLTSHEEDVTLFDYNPRNMKRLQHIIQIVQTAGDHDRLLQGVYENFPKLKFPRSREAIDSGLEWFCWSDVLEKCIKTDQSFVLLPYLSYSFAAWHFLFSTTSWPKISYPSVGYENHMKQQRCQQVLNDLMRGLRPCVRTHVHSKPLLLDVLPMFDSILTPALRPVNTRLYNEREREELAHVVDVMIEYNLSYVQHRAPDGSYYYQYDPNIEELTKIETSNVAKTGGFSYNMKQLVSREVTMEKMRRTESAEGVTTPGRHPDNTSSNPTSKTPSNSSKQTEVPNHLRKLTPKQIKVDHSQMVSEQTEVPNYLRKLTPKQIKVDDSQMVSEQTEVPNYLRKLTPKQIKVDHSQMTQYKDFFGRVVQIDKSKLPQNRLEVRDNVVKSNVWFCYKEGFNNAVKKDITMSDLL